METLQVALGRRSYPIYIGGGLLEQAEELLRPLGVGRWAIVCDDTVAALYGAPLARRTGWPLVTFPAGEGSEVAGGVRPAVPPAGAAGPDPQRWHRGPGRRRHRRSGGLCGGHAAAWCGAGAGPHHPAGAGGQRRRRQNGAGSAGGEKPAGLLLPAPYGTGGYRLPRHLAPASAGLRHGRGHQIRLHLGC